MITEAITHELDSVSKTSIVDGSLILESDDEYIELQGKGEIELSCGAASVILKKQIKDDMYTIDVNLKSIGEA